MYVSGACNKFPFSATAITEIASGRFLAVRVVPSKGSTAMSNGSPLPVPNFSPIKSIGASSISPSPITIFPFMSILFK